MLNAENEKISSALSRVEVTTLPVKNNNEK